MTSSPDKTPVAPLQVTRHLTLAYTVSIFIALLMAVVSLGGLVFSSTIYSTNELLETYVPNDVINLILGLPLLLSSMWFTRRGKLIGLLCWPGALLYVIYNYLVYLFGMPLSWLTLGYMALVLSSAHSIFELLRSIDQKSVQQQLSGVIPVKIGGWFLVVFGTLFISRAVGMIAQANISQASFPVTEVGTLIADVVISTLWIVCGTSLLQQKPIGFVSSPGLLFVASTLFISLVLFLFLQPILTNAPFALIDVVAVSMMGIVCFIPTGLFARGILSSRKLR